MRCLVDSWTSTTHAHFDLRLLGLFSPQVSPCPRFRTLQGMAESTDDSNFFTCDFHGVLELHVLGIDEMGATQLSSIVELRLFRGPMLFLYSLRSFRHS